MSERAPGLSNPSRAPGLPYYNPYTWDSLLGDLCPHLRAFKGCDRGPRLRTRGVHNHPACRRRHLWLSPGVYPCFQLGSLSPLVLPLKIAFACGHGTWGPEHIRQALCH